MQDAFWPPTFHLHLPDAAPLFEGQSNNPLTISSVTRDVCEENKSVPSPTTHKSQHPFQTKRSTAKIFAIFGAVLKLGITQPCQYTKMHYYYLLGAIFAAVGACADHPFDHGPAAARAVKALWKLETLKQGHTAAVNVIKYKHTTEIVIDKSGFSYKEAGRATSGLSDLKTRSNWIQISDTLVETDSERGGGAIIRIDPLNLVVGRDYQIAYQVDELDGRQPDPYVFNAPAPPEADAPETPDSSTTDLGPTFTETDTGPTETVDTTSVEPSDQPSVTSTTSTDDSVPGLVSLLTTAPVQSIISRVFSETSTSSTSSESPTSTESGAAGTVHRSSGPGWSLFLFLASLFV